MEKGATNRPVPPYAPGVMSDPLRDPDLDDLVRELNRREGSVQVAEEETSLAFEPVEQPLPLGSPSQSLVG